MSSKINYAYDTKTILELSSLQANGHLNLEPGFQRKSVWTISDRRRFIESVLEGLPVPSIFLYRRDDNGIPIYDVLDGKQRLETIFMFSKVKPFKTKGFEVRFKFDDDDEPCWYDWRALNRYCLTSDFLTFKLQVAEVSGAFSEIQDLFVRINSTGKPLTSSERRHAKFYKSPFLKEAKRLARQHQKYFLEKQIMSPTGVDRMKDVELVSELIASLLHGGPINKKQAVDRAVGNGRVPARDLQRAVQEFSATLHVMKRMFPDLTVTRFRNIAEFYTLFLVVWEMQQRKLVLSERKRNQAAMELLRSFSNGVDEVRERQRTARGAKAEQQLYADYLMLVQQSTDALEPRKRRMDIIRGLLGGLFESKDDQRIFSVEQRRLLWNSDDKKRCGTCGELLDWTNFQVDHVKPHSLGGKTTLRNAALLCASCNASKGARRNGGKKKTQKRARRA